MYFTISELKLIIWVVLESWILLLSIVGYFDLMKTDWAEIKRLRAEKEALTGILLAFLGGRAETQAPKGSKTNEEERK